MIYFLKHCNFISEKYNRSSVIKRIERGFLWVSVLAQGLFLSDKR